MSDIEEIKQQPEQEAEDSTKPEEGDQKDTPEDVAAKFIASLDEPVQKRVHELQDLQKQYDEQWQKFREEELALMKKYEKLYEPIFDKRREVVKGSGDEEGIPEFWLKALQNCDATQERIEERDEDCLKSLQNITAEALEKDGIRLNFHFAENAYFTNGVLTKTYINTEEGYETMFDHAEGCDIDWKEGKNLTVVMKKKRQKSKKGQIRTQIKQEPCESFFNFFKPPSPDDMEDEEDPEQLDELMEADHEVGMAIATRVIPQAVDWFTGAAVREMDDEDFDDDEEEEEDDEDGDEEDEEPQPKKGKKRGGKGGKADVQALQKAAQDCKQQ